MKLKIALLFGYMLVMISACKNENVPSPLTKETELPIENILSQEGDHSVDEIYSDKLYKKGGNGSGKGRGRNDDPPADTTVQDPFVKTYQLYQADDADPLYKFSISNSGVLMMLESDPNAGSWGSDYYGLWDEPFQYSGNQVFYGYGLTATYYNFEFLSDDLVGVTKTRYTTVYLSSRVDTTITYPGIYKLQ